jgi:hypothetical protein
LIRDCFIRQWVGDTSPAAAARGGLTFLPISRYPQGSQVDAPALSSYVKYSLARQLGGLNFSD